MGFFSGMKGRNNYWGIVTGDSFPGVCYLGPKNFVDNRSHVLSIRGGSLKEPYFFTKKELSYARLIAPTSSWMRFLFCFRDGKSAIVTVAVLSTEKPKDGVGLTTKGQSVQPSMAIMNLECWLGDKLYSLPAQSRAETVIEQERPLSSDQIKQEEREEDPDDDEEEYEEEDDEQAVKISRWQETLYLVLIIVGALLCGILLMLILFILKK
ncbi:MAG: hypothetical protein KIG36_02175 [Eubacteriales bacterium]|nr:hypothetical protein [Eubacteriales bacterium]